MGIGEILRSKTRPFDVLRSFRVNDISWCVWAGSGRSIGLTASTEGSGYWRRDLAIYVTMKGLLSDLSPCLLFLNGFCG